MDQDLQTILGGEAVGMEGFRDSGHFAVHGAKDLAVFGNDGDAVTQDLLGKNIVGYLIQRHQLASQGRQ